MRFCERILPLNLAAINLLYDRKVRIAEMENKGVGRMKNRAVQKFLVGVLVSFACELVRQIWQEKVQKVQEDQHKHRDSEYPDSYSRGGCDEWDLSSNN